MIEIRKTRIFDSWLNGLRDLQARARIQARLARLAAGNTGDVKPVGGGVSELRIDHVPDYLVYYTQRGSDLVILLRVVTRNPRPPTSKPPCAWRTTFRRRR